MIDIIIMIEIYYDYDYVTLFITTQMSYNCVAANEFLVTFPSDQIQFKMALFEER